ncbi:MAG TPA: hypothetical protein VGK67_08550 [Myxococcales bacterium]
MRFLARRTRASPAGLAVAVAVAVAAAALAASAGIASAAEAPPPPVVVAAFDFTTSLPDGADKARSLGVMVVTRLAQRPRVRVVGEEEVRATIDLARARALSLGESDPGTVPPLVDAKVGLRGTYELFGERRVLTAVTFDPRTAKDLKRFRVDAPSDDDLPPAADRLGDQIAESLGLSPAEADAELVSSMHLVGGPVVLLNVKLGSTLAGLEGFSVDAFTLRFDLEGEVVLSSWLHGYVEIGLQIGQAKSNTTQAQGTFSIVPAGTGLKFVFRSDAALRPFVGLGFGLGYFTAMLDSTKKVAFRGDLTTGVTWMPWERVGLVAELRAALDTSLTYGFSADFGLSFAF